MRKYTPLHKILTHKIISYYFPHHFYANFKTFPFLSQLLLQLLVCVSLAYDPRLDLHQDLRKLKQQRGENPYGKLVQFDIHAWACDKPDNIVSLSYNARDNCGANPQEPKQGRAVFVTVLQEEKRRRHQGFSCSIAETRITYHCGAFDHITLLSKKSTYNIPKAVSYQDCRKMILDQTYIIETGEQHTVHKEGLTIISYTPVGKDYRSDGGEIECVGEETFINGKKYTNTVISVQLMIRLKKEDIWYTPATKELHAFNSQLLLPCPENQRFCETQEFTFVWTVQPESKCMMAELRTFQADEIKSVTGATVIIATDKSMNRFVKKSKTIKCYKEVYRTENEKIFVQIESKDDSDQWRDIHTSEISMTAYTQHREEFLYYHITTQMRKEFQTLLLEDCRRQHDFQKILSRAEHSSPGVQTWHLGNGTFGTTAGDIIYTYECRKEIVKP